MVYIIGEDMIAIFALGEKYCFGLYLDFQNLRNKEKNNDREILNLKLKDDN